MAPEMSPQRRLRVVAQQLVASPVLAAGPSDSPALARYTGQVCIVTGGAGGIGRCIAERLAAEGAHAVCLFDMTDCTEAIAALISAAPAVHAIPVNVNLTEEAAVTRAVSQVVDQFGRVDVLVQSAGITGKVNVKTHEVDPVDFAKVFDVNVKAIFLGARAVLPSMLRTGYGRIVNIASISGKEGNAGMLAYSSSKAAVIALTKVIGKEYVNMGKDITVNCVAPAVVRTAMVDAMPPEQVKYMTDKIPMGRCCTMEEVATTVTFAASRECSFTTGFCFDSTGGRTVY